MLARPGNVLSFGGCKSGCRAYVAFAGGLDAPVMLGSRATDLGCGCGGHRGRPLQKGDVLGVLAAKREPPQLSNGAPVVHGGFVAAVVLDSVGLLVGITSMRRIH